MSIQNIRLEVMQLLEKNVSSYVDQYLIPVEKIWQPSDFLPNSESDNFLEEVKELREILVFSQDKLLQYFTICRGIWDLSFESTSIKLRKNKKNLSKNKSYTVYQDLFNKEVYVWECKFEKLSRKKHDTKILFSSEIEATD